MSPALTTAAAVTYRRAVPADVPALVRMLHAFATATPYGRFVGERAEAFEAFLRPLVTNPSAAVFVAEQEGTVVGMLGVLGYVHPMSGERCAGELFWWLDPAHRGPGVWLLRRAEAWARAFGAVSLQMIAPFDKPAVGQIYQRLGYEPVEIAYQRRLKECV